MKAVVSTGIGISRKVSLVTALSLALLAPTFSSWACASWNPLTGDGDDRVVLALLVVPATAAVLTVFAVWRSTKLGALATGTLVAVVAFVGALMGCD